MKRKSIIIISTLYWLLLSINTFYAKKIDYSTSTEWWINTIVMLLIIAISLLTYKVNIKIIYKILILPIAWLCHAILTIPSGILLGIIKFDPENIRKASEHRAIFVISSIPVLFYFVSNSKLFNK